MYKILLTLCLLCLVGCSQPVDKPEKEDPVVEEEISNKIQVVLMFGQSNMEGHTHSRYLLNTVGTEKSKEYVDGYDDVKISYACTISQNTSNYQFVPVKCGQGTSLNQFGPEVGMAEKINALNLKEKVYFIKFAQGATSLYNSWRSPSSKMTGSLYSFAIEYVNKQLKALEDMGYYPEVKAICWMQGEDDSNSNSYTEYYNYEKAFINDLRKEFLYYSDPEGIGFISAGISDCPAWREYKEINKSKLKLSNESAFNIYIDTIAADLKYGGEPVGAPDIYHYDSSSMIKLGHLFADELIANFLTLNDE